MAVAFDKITDLGSFGSTPDPFTGSVTPVGTPRGVSVFIHHGGVTDFIDGVVSYGGVTLNRIDRTVDTGGEQGVAYHYFIGAGLPTGTQTVSIAHTGAGATKYATVITYTGASDLEIKAHGTAENNQANPAIVLDSSTDTALRVGAITSGINDVADIAPISGYTEAFELGINLGAGAGVISAIYETTPSSGSSSLGWTSAIDDVAAVAAAIGEVAGGTTTLTADSGTYTETGTAANLEFHHKMPATTGTYALTGTAASLEFHRKLAAGIGTYALTGTAASLKFHHVISADTVAYAVTGTDATLRKGITMIADVGSYSLTGTAADLLFAHKLAVDSGTYALTGTDVTFRKGINMTADAGVYSFTGTAASLLFAHKLAVDSGVYAITGTDATLQVSISMAADSGGFVMTGTATDLLRALRLAAQSGAYVITGTDAVLWSTVAGIPEIEFIVTMPYVQTLVASYSAPIRGTMFHVQRASVSPFTQVAVSQALIDTIAESYGAPIMGTAPPNQITRGFSE